jgi:hypothetical protein
MALLPRRLRRSRSRDQFCSDRVILSERILCRCHLEKINAPTRYHGPLLIKSMFVLAVMVVLFFFGEPVAKLAKVGGAFLLLTRRVRPEKIYFEIDWPLLVMFGGFADVPRGASPNVMRYGVNPSSKVRAACRSAVAKPSVNRS